MTHQHLQVQLAKEQPWWARMWKYPIMEHYNRLVFTVFLINGFVFFMGLSQWQWFNPEQLALGQVNQMMAINLAMAVLVRQQYVINGLFWLATRAPVTWPLSIRWHLGKVYHHGGLHSGGAMAATLWFFVFAALISYQWQNQLPGISQTTVWLAYGLVVLLLLILVMATPKIRRNFHNSFERTHRFGGWSALILFWLLAYSFHQDQHANQFIWRDFLLSVPTLLLVSVTLSILLPWLRLKKVPVTIETPSNHVALLKFDYGVTPFAGSSTAISRSPLLEWHQFANVPEPDTTGFKLTVSRAGDWTGKLIEDRPSHLWVKGIPTAGVANIEVLFKRVVYVATGSGIGPCLPHLFAQKLPMHLIWSTRSPRKTYGDELVDDILAVQPDALIWNTDERGKPDMVKLAYAAYEEFNAEAVIVIANQKLTQQVVFGLESRGIPAFGAIWDS